MAKYSAMVLGTRAERKIDFPGTETKLAVRPLTGLEVSAAYEKAAEYAKATEGALFGMAQMAASIAIACLDIDSPPNARLPFFDGGFQQAMGLDYEVIAYLYEHLASWQAHCSPYATKVPFSELMALVDAEVESDDDSFFLQLAPVTRWSFTHTLACLCASLPEARLLLSSLTSNGGETLSEKPWRPKSDEPVQRDGDTASASSS